MRPRLVVLTAPLYLLLSSFSAAQTNTVLCASNDMGRQSCPADTRSGVRLSRQISGSPCTLGDTWGFDTSGIWVDKGCRAEFEVSATVTTSAANPSGAADNAPQAKPSGPCGAGLVDDLSQRLNIRHDQARAAAGELFALARARLDGGDFRRLSDLVPEMNDLLKAAPDKKHLSSSGAWDSVISALQKLGLSRSAVITFVPVLIDEVRCRGGQDIDKLLGKALLGNGPSR